MNELITSLLQNRGIWLVTSLGFVYGFGKLVVYLRTGILTV